MILKGSYWAIEQNPSDDVLQLRPSRKRGPNGVSNFSNSTFEQVSLYILPEPVTLEGKFRQQNVGRLRLEAIFYYI